MLPVSPSTANNNESYNHKLDKRLGDNAPAAREDEPEMDGFS